VGTLDTVTVKGPSWTTVLQFSVLLSEITVKSGNHHHLSVLQQKTNEKHRYNRYLQFLIRVNNRVIDSLYRQAPRPFGGSFAESL